MLQLVEFCSYCQEMNEQFNNYSIIKKKSNRPETAGKNLVANESNNYATTTNCFKHMAREGK